jgi:hypothetical protein
MAHISGFYTRRIEPVRKFADYISRASDEQVLVLGTIQLEQSFFFHWSGKII